MNRALLSIRSMNAASFAYTPPDAVYGTMRCLLITGHVEKPILREVIKGFWRLAPATRLMITLSDALEEDMLGANMRAVDLDALPNRPFVSRVRTGKFVTAPPLLAEVDCCVTLTSAGESPDTPPSLNVVSALSPVAVSPADAYAALGHLFVGACVHAGDQVIWGDDLVEVDRAVYRTLKQPEPQALLDTVEIARQIAQQQP
jgi:hypothetical protein